MRWSTSASTAANVHTEVFGSGPPRRQGSPSHLQCRPTRRRESREPAQSVTFARSGLTVPWRADFASLLELGRGVRRAHPLVVPHRGLSQLRDGARLRCREYDPEPVDPPVLGAVLVCCAEPKGEVVLDL